MKKKPIAIILVLAAVGAGIYAYSHGFGRTPDHRLLVSGNVELTEVNIAFKTPGRLIERAVDEGDTVKKGQIVARLDRDQLTAQREREAASLAVQESQLAQDQTSIEWQKATLAADVEQRSAGLSMAQSRLQELKNGSRPQEVQESRAAVEAAQSELDRAKRDWDRAQTLYKNDDISTAQYDQYRSRWESADAMLRQAQQRAAMVQLGPRAEVVESASGQVRQAQGTLKMAEANSLELKRREQALATRRAQIESAKASLALIDTQLAETVAASPCDGVVLVKSADPGEVLGVGTTVLTVGDIDHPWLRGYINETALGKVKVGSKARITTDSYPGKVYNGRVSFISSEAEFTPKQIQTQEERVKLVYRIKIDVENTNHELKSNMPADAEIVVD
jgi:HlyD family secretion protein